MPATMIRPYGGGRRREGERMLRRVERILGSDVRDASRTLLHAACSGVADLGITKATLNRVRDLCIAQEHRILAGGIYSSREDELRRTRRAKRIAEGAIFVIDVTRERRAKRVSA